MADIASNIDKMDDIEIAANAPMTETLMNKIAANINALIDLSPFENSQIFTASGTFNVPEGVNAVFLRGCGGGGGGGGSEANVIGGTGNPGTQGGSTTFGGLSTFIGGLGGSGINGNATGGRIVYPHSGGHGGVTSLYGVGSVSGIVHLASSLGAPSAYFNGGAGGASTSGGGGGGAGPFGVGAAGGSGTAGSTAVANSGGGGGGGSAGNAGAQGGQGAIMATNIVLVTPLAAITVTLGGGGAGGTFTNSGNIGGVGGSGQLTVFW